MVADVAAAADGGRKTVDAAVAVAESLVAVVAGTAAKVVGVESIVADTVVAVGKVVAAAVRVAVLVVAFRYSAVVAEIATDNVGVTEFGEALLVLFD
jgi:hypothetical protein